MDLDKLKYYVSQRLVDLSGINVYDLNAPNNAEFPYLTYKFTSSSNTVRKRTDWILEIDYWDNTNDDTDILLAVKNVKNGVYDGDDLIVPGLDYSYQYEKEGFYQCYQEFEAEIPQPESNMCRMNQSFLLEVR
jgi:hypothetical protein